MGITPIGFPTFEAGPVTIDEAKVHLIAEGDDAERDQKIESALRAAIEFCEASTQRILARSAFVMTIDGWPSYGAPYFGRTIPYNAIEIPARPVRSIDEISYYDEDGALQIIPNVDDANYSAEFLDDNHALVVFKSEYTFPTLYWDRGSRVSIAFTAGYDNPGESGSGQEPRLKMPHSLRAAILMKTEAIFEAGAIDPARLADLNEAVDNLLSPLRPF